MGQASVRRSDREDAAHPAPIERTLRRLPRSRLRTRQARAAGRRRSCEGQAMTDDTPTCGTPEWTAYWQERIDAAQRERFVTIGRTRYPRIAYGAERPN